MTSTTTDEPSTPTPTATTQEALDSLAITVSSPDSPEDPNGLTKNHDNLNPSPIREPPSTAALVNGILSNGHTHEHDDNDHDDLREELEKTREERDNISAQYRLLLARVEKMKTTLGNKLRVDAEELDKREAHITQLSLQVEDLTSTIETLQTELLSSNADISRLTSELDSSLSNSRALASFEKESLSRERELREMHSALEDMRQRKEELERQLAATFSVEEELRDTKKILEEESLRRRDMEKALQSEAERAAGLEGVLGDWEAAKALELSHLATNASSNLSKVRQELNTWRDRAEKAEAQVATSSTSSTRVEELESEVKEKSAIIGKLRHQSVILNEHLTEALRRLGREKGEGVVDRRLVTNILLSFLSTPRADSKRFEMLSLLGSILQFTEDDREKAGLAKSSNHPPPIKRRESVTSESGGGGGIREESFSNMWVEFLMKEANQGAEAAAPRPVPTPNGSAVSSPTSELGPTLGGLPMKGRVASLSSVTGGGLKKEKRLL